VIAGIHQVGLNKAVVCARRIYEDNPYAKLTLLQRGVNEAILEKLLRAGRVNCIVEEIDNMRMKVVVRKLARKYKVPVLMITDNGDWAVLHVERYDLGYKRIFERTDRYFENKIKKLKGPKEFADIVINDIVGGPEKIDPRMMASVNKVFDRKFVSWPQLGSSALLGSVAVIVAIKEIVRGEDKKLFRREYLKIL
jgi:hypothetical protein